MADIKEIQDAITSKNVIAIEYRDLKGNVSLREIEPYEIKDGGVYGYCLAKNGIRKFNLSGILGVETKEDVYTPRF